MSEPVDGRGGGPASVARSHHYVPAFYLSGFTDSGQRGGFLWVHDKATERVWRSRPDETACERDYYRVDLEGLRPDAVERDILGGLETQGAEVLAQILETTTLPLGASLEVFNSFVTLLSVRTPGFRERFVQFKRQAFEMSGRAALAQPATFEAFRRDMVAAGTPIPEDITYEGMVAFMEDRSRWRIEVPRELVVKNLLEMYSAVLPVVERRKWNLFEAIENHFICSDNPVALRPTSRDAGRFFGFNSPHTELILPLSRKLAVVGSFEEGGFHKRVCTAEVGLFNSLAWTGRTRFAYSSAAQCILSRVRARGEPEDVPPPSI